MTDFGTWIIVYSLLTPTGQTPMMSASTRFDEASCMRQAKAVNHEWFETHFKGFATCRQVQDK
jgi:hypothetical protein